jgi:monoamine oxidase
VVVIGGGVAGLRAAQQLSARGFRVKVLEARPQLGGRVRQDTTFIPGRPLELGAEFIHGDVNPVVELCEARGWARRHLFTWSHGDGGPAEACAPDGGAGYYFLGREGRLLRFDCDDPDFHLCSEALWRLPEFESADDADGRSLRRYLQDEGVPERMLGLACAGYGNTAGGTAASVPARAAMKYERAWRGDGTELDPDFRMEPSFGVLIEHLAEGLDVATSAPVAAVEVLRGGARVRVTPAPGCGVAPLLARRAVVAVPLPVLRDGDIAFSPPFSSEKTAALRSMAFANGVKAVLKFRRRCWPEDCHGAVCADSFFPEMWMNSAAGVGGLIQGTACQFPASALSPYELNLVEEGAKAEGSAEGGYEDDDTTSTPACGSVGESGPEPSSLVDSLTHTGTQTGTGSYSCEVRGVHGGGGGSSAASVQRRPGSPSPLSPAASGARGGGAAAGPPPRVVRFADEEGGAAGAGGDCAAAPAADDGPFVVTGFVMGERADAMLAEHAQPAILARLLAQIDAMFGMDAIGSFEGGFVHNWGKEPFIRGAYSTPTSREDPAAVVKLREPHAGAVFFAGEATAGAVDGSLRHLPANRAHYASPIVLHGALNTGALAAGEVAASLGVAGEEDAAGWRQFIPTYTFKVPPGEGGKGGTLVWRQSVPASPCTDAEV